MANETLGIMIDGELKTLLDANHKRRQAELNLDRARAAEAMAGRTAVPRFVEQLKMRREKEQAQRQKIAAQGEAQGPTAQEMIPQEVAVTGQPRPKGDLGSLVGLAGQAQGIAQRVAGGPQPAAGQGPATPFVGTGMQAAGAAGQAGAAMVLGQQGAAQAGQAVPQTPSDPSMATPIYKPLTGLQQGLRLPRAIGALANRNFIGAFQELEEFITGKQEVGLEPPTTLDMQAAQHAPVLAALQARMEEAQTPEQAVAAQIEFQDWVSDLRGRVPSEVIERAILMGMEQRVLDEYKQEQARQAFEEKERIKAEHRPMDVIRNKVIEAGTMDVLSAGEKSLLKLGQQKVDVKIMQEATKNRVEGDLNAGLGVMQQLRRVKDALAGYPDFFNRFESAANAIREEKDKLGLLDAEGQKRLADYTTAKQAMDYLVQQQVRSIAGATMSAAEIKLTLDPLVRPGVSPTQAQVLLDGFVDDLAVSLYRNDKLRKMGFDDPSTASTLSNTRQMIRGDMGERFMELRGQGMEDAQAIFQVDAEFQGRYGLDAYKIMGMKRP